MKLEGQIWYNRHWVELMKLVYKKNDEIGIEMNEHKWWTKVLSGLMKSKYDL